MVIDWYICSTVNTSMTIFNELINTCHGDLALFASPVCEMMILLLSSSSMDHKSIGTETVSDSLIVLDVWCNYLYPMGVV